MSARLNESIIKTLAFYDLFQFPLTDWEIYKNLWQPDKTYSYNEILVFLQNRDSSVIEEKEGFYFFEGRAGIVEHRKNNYLISEEKLKKNHFFLSLVAQIPFVKAIFLYNTVSYQNASTNSDLDLAIITEPNRIWTARFISAGIMRLLNKRPTDTKQKDQICLSFFISETKLDLESIAYDEDAPFIYWISLFLPLFDADNSTTIKKYFRENEKWTKNFLPNFVFNETNERWRLKERPFFKKLFTFLLKGRLGDWLESRLKSWQRNHLPSTLKNKLLENNTDVIMNDELLKLHDKDARLHYKKLWEENFAKRLTLT